MSTTTMIAETVSSSSNIVNGIDTDAVHTLIDEVFARIRRVFDEGVGDRIALCAADTVHEGVTHVWSDLENPRTDAWAKVRMEH